VIIQALCELYNRLERGGLDESGLLAPFGYSVQKVSFVIVLERDGRLHAIEDIREEPEQRSRGQGTSRRVPRSLVVPAIPGRTVAVEPGFLCDNTAYVLGLGGGGTKPDRVGKCFREFRDRHLALRATIKDKGFAAVCAFLEAWDPSGSSRSAGASSSFMTRTRCATTGTSTSRPVPRPPERASPARDKGLSSSGPALSPA
jgi:CRISPR-associated protein Csd1